MTADAAVHPALHALASPAGRAWLADATGVPDIGLVRQRVWPDRGGIATEYGLCGPGPDRPGTLVAVDRPVRARPTRRCARWEPTGWSGIRIPGPGGHGWCFTPDQDPALRVLRDLLQGRRHLRTFGLPDDPAPVLVNYRACKRAVLRCERDDRLTYLKVLRRAPDPGQWAARCAIATALAMQSGGRIRSPNTVICPEEPRLLHSPGIRDGHEPLAHEVAGVLHAMQGLLGLDLPVHGPGDEAKALHRWIALWSRIRTDPLPPVVGRVVPALATQPVDGPLHVIHRDFHHGQLIACPTTVWLLDLDTVAVGHPEIDVATWAAHHLFHRIQSGDTLAAALSELNTHLHAWRATGIIADPQRLPSYLAGALCRLAINMTLRGVATAWTAALWTAADDICGGAALR